MVHPGLAVGVTDSIVSGMLMATVVVLAGRRRQRHRGHLLADPVRLADLAGLQGRELENVALLADEGQRELEGVALVGCERGGRGVDDLAGALRDLVAVLLGDGLVERLGDATDGPARIDRGRDRLDRVGDADRDRGGRRSVAAVADREGQHRVGAGGGRAGADADVGARRQGGGEGEQDSGPEGSGGQGNSALHYGFFLTLR